MAGSEIEKNMMNPETRGASNISESPVSDTIPGETGGAGVRKISSKLELWENKLLDLTTRNMLLSLPRRSASVLPIVSSRIEELENSLADGREFQLKPIPEWITDVYIDKAADGEDRESSARKYVKIEGLSKETGKAAAQSVQVEVSAKVIDLNDLEKAAAEAAAQSDQKKAGAKAIDLKDLGKSSAEAAAQSALEEDYVNWLEERLRTSNRFEIFDWPTGKGFDVGEDILQEYKKHRLYCFGDKKQLDREVTAVYRAARASQQENGVSSLYLAMGLLKWYGRTPSGGLRKAPAYAPIILFPVEIIRKSVFRGYALHARDEEPHFNLTLLELLRRNYNTEIQGVDPLPGDEHGIDIKKTFDIVREALAAFKNWEVLETCAIGNFSFAQFSMWRDIHTGVGMLNGSKVVRSLMKGHVDWVDSDFSINSGAAQRGAIKTPPEKEPYFSIPDDVNQRGALKTPREKEPYVPINSGAAQRGAIKTPPEKEPYLPITVDATQLEAIKMAAQGRTFVLHGPPGTGKSQTITGMIANLLAEGKTVLFVAEKMAALTVVQRRLEALGISDFCLELHSDKANKKHILTQLDKALESYASWPEKGFYERRRQAEEAGARLDGYVRSLHAPQKCGYSLRQMIDYYETVRDTKECIRFRTEEAAAITKEKLLSHLSLIGQLTAAGEVLRNIKESPLTDLGLQSYTADVRLALLETMEEYEDSLNRLRDAYRNASAVLVSCGLLKADRYLSLYELDNLLTVYFREKNPDPVLGLILAADQGGLQDYYKKASKLLEDRRRLLTIWRPELLEKQLDDYLVRHERAGKKLFGRAKAMEYVTDELRAYTDMNLSYGEIPAMLQVVADYQKNLSVLQQLFGLLTREQKMILEKYPTLDQYVNAVQEAVCFKKDIDVFPGGIESIRRLAANPASDRALEEYSDAFRVFSEREKTFGELLHRESGRGGKNAKSRFSPPQADNPAANAMSDIQAFPGGQSGLRTAWDLFPNSSADKLPDCDDPCEWIQTELDYCEYVRTHTAELKNRGLYNKVREDCIRAGIGPVVREYEQGMPAEKIPGAYRKGLYYALINDAVGNDDVLSCFSGATFNEAVEQFGRMDHALMELTVSEIRRLLESRVPGENEGTEIGRELNILRKAIKSGGRGISIRELFGRIPHILPRLCPCILMSPGSAAQYLEQKNDIFDVAIFDEASQIPTCKAVGALARAKSAVIVGDPKQMPPTAFFAAAGPDVDDVELYDLDSILDDALALGIHSHYLQWHYRSTHESLIAFSNREFYDNKIFSFPSADDREYHVRTVHVNGLYGDGINEKEARAVVEEILRRYRDPVLREQSIGVVTFNVKQQALIENLLASQFLDNPALDEWANDGENPLFVKNLENVQGDERDAILFSVGYGPDENGLVSNNFGPINQAGGAKRLNVAFSRARVTMTIFTSLNYTDIKVTPSSSAGVVAFRDFLNYADMEKSSDGGSIPAAAEPACAFAEPVSEGENSEKSPVPEVEDIVSEGEKSPVPEVEGIVSEGEKSPVPERAEPFSRSAEPWDDESSHSSPAGDFAYDGSGILQSICREIRNAGYTCDTMIGRSDFHIDIAVYDPYDAGRYMLGILLDGETYRRAGNTRDREISQSNVLKTLGWSLHRIWTMDWWDNRSGEIIRLLEILDRLKIESEQRAAR